MAHSLSARKRVRQNVKQRARNRARKGSMRTQIKKFQAMAHEGGDMEALGKELSTTQKRIDKVAAKGTIHRNTASRKKSQLARLMNETKAKAGA